MNKKMENKNFENKISEKENTLVPSLPVSIIISVAMISGLVIYKTQLNNSDYQKISNLVESEKMQKTELEEKVLPSDGVTLPVKWGDLGRKLVSVGAIDEVKFKALYETRGQFTKEYEELLFGDNKDNLIITEKNASFLLNIFWALGLSSGNSILNDVNEMRNPNYGGAGNFASTGGWTLAVGNPMDHYNRHMYFELTPDEQDLVDKVSRGIYRPCCNNSTHFPDCNHGMAMLGLLQLMAKQGLDEQEMWRNALVVNSYWFPDTYITLATYMKNKGIEWNDVDPQEILGINYSSASGYSRIASQIVLPTKGNSSGCGIDAGQSNRAQQRQQSGCGI